MEGGAPSVETGRAYALRVRDPDAAPAGDIDDAGFEIRDVICWHYRSGFPKSLDIVKAIDKENGAGSATAEKWAGSVRR